MPVSLVLADDPIMLVIKPGEHGSTFGGNPLAVAICIEALQVVADEKLAECRTPRAGVPRPDEGVVKKTKLITLVRGKGLLNANRH